MRDHEGVEWLRPAEIAARLGVARGTVYVWIQRRKVRVVKLDGHAHVHYPDAAEAEAATRGKYRSLRVIDN